MCNCPIKEEAFILTSARYWGKRNKELNSEDLLEYAVHFTGLLLKRRQRYPTHLD